MGRTIAWLFGGACCAGGVLNLIYSFGPAYTVGTCAAPSCAGINTALDKAGWDALADFALKDSAAIAFPLIFLGIAILVSLNASAWKTTDGY
jgi:hypothetical protein